ncbi:MAG TPA: ABC transporter permease, partial [bacterium]|nr:ABC transporter permease [bacterium]
RDNQMRKIALICGKELRAYFGAMIGYIILSAFLAVSGVAFFYWVNQFRTSSMRPVFQIICVVLLLTSPAVTMRLLAGEFASGTSDLLLASPITPLQIVLGKFLFCVCMVIIMLLCTCDLPLLVLHYGTPDMGAVWAGYLGLFLAGAFFCSVGLFASSLTRNAAVASVTGVGILLALLLLPGGKTFPLAAALSPFAHFAGFAKGVLDTSDLAYFVLGIFFFLFLTARILRLRQQI